MRPKSSPPSRIRSVGFLLFESKDRVTITGHISDEDDESGAFTIPRGCITKMIRLGSGK